MAGLAAIFLLIFPICDMALIKQKLHEYFININGHSR